LEGANRRVYRFNEVVDVNVAQPVARAYTRVVPNEIRDRVRNFFGNIGDVFIGVNNFLQGKFEEGVGDWARVAFNSTIGLFRIHEEAALDKYVFQRDAYLQRRRSLVYDGHPPREKEPEDEEPQKPR